MARSADSRRVSDVPGFDEYLQEACVYLQDVGASDKKDASLYQCSEPRHRQHSFLRD